MARPAPEFDFVPTLLYDIECEEPITLVAGKNLAGRPNAFLLFIGVPVVRSQLRWILSVGAYADAYRFIEDGRKARLRIVGKPERLCAELLKKMNLKLPIRPKIVQNVVQKNALFET